METLRKVCAVDFDGTLCEVAFPDIGEPKLEIITYVKALQRNGYALILWTNREGDLLKDAVEWCNELGLYFDAVNENLPERTAYFGNDCRKIGADIYIDDKSVNPKDIENSVKIFELTNSIEVPYGKFERCLLRSKSRER